MAARPDAMNNDDYFMNIAFLASKRCDLSQEQVSFHVCAFTNQMYCYSIMLVVALSPENVVIGVGHHSLVEGMSKDSLEPKDEITDYCE